MRTTRSRRSLRLLASTSLVACALISAPVAIDYQLDKPVLKVAQAESCCFVAGTRVLMADGGERFVERLAPGDRVLGRDGRINRVVGIEVRRLGTRKLYGFNDGRPFVTAEHPFFTPGGWKSIDPSATALENRLLRVRRLSTGDLLAVARSPVTADGRGNLALAEPIAAAPGSIEIGYVAVRRISVAEAEPESLVYNLRLDGDHCYFADGYLVHNKDGDGGGEGGGGEGGGGEGGGGDGGGEGGEGGGGGGDGGGDGGGEGGDGGGDGGGEGGEGGDGGGEGGDDGGEGGEGGDDGGDDGGEGGEGGDDDGGEGGEGGDDGDDGGDDKDDDRDDDDRDDDDDTSGRDDDDDSAVARGGVRAGFFGGLNQVGADLSPGEEADAIGSGWQ